jgi:hypothetical protein
MADPKRPTDEKDPSLGKRPTQPGQKRPSNWGVGSEHSKPPPDAERSPTSKTPV